MAKFTPQSQTNTVTVRHINYTCSPERYTELEKVAKRSSISLKELLRQMAAALTGKRFSNFHSHRFFHNPPHPN